jgi:hypothetical protein
MCITYNVLQGSKTLGPMAGAGPAGPLGSLGFSQQTSSRAIGGGGGGTSIWNAPAPAPAASSSVWGSAGVSYIYIY